MPMQLLGGLTPHQFLRDYWQKQPLLIRQAVPGFVSPLTPDELAGLACEAGVESRLVLERGAGRPWQLEQGPFAEARFARLPESHWTLLVQRVNQWVPEVAALLDGFDFLPGWRLDDIMISYASDQGSVGPHTDQYDVFLLQGLGRRRWQIDSTVPADAPLRDHPDLRILRDFSATEQWVLEPGDMLYLPPGLAHYGVSLGEGMTYSVGFRAPAHRDLLSGWVDDVIALLPDTLRHADPDLAMPAHPGEIDAAALQRVRDILHQRFVEDTRMDRWFGRFITEPGASATFPLEKRAISPTEFVARLRNAGELWRSEASRLAFLRQAETVLLYVDGDEYPLSPPQADLAILLCDTRRYPVTSLEPYLEEETTRELLAELFNRGALELPDE
ncbi:MAG TPA: cupin domain-containing protein [Chromatiales bacterium]|nr:cupin domain-containing protein [Chromatiales bacterium]